MKRGLLLTMAMLAAIFATFSFFIPGNSSALLTADAQLVWDDRGTVTTNDDMYWVRILSLFTNQTYDQQLATISALSISGYTGFHLASNTEVGSLFAYGASTVVPLFPATFIEDFPTYSYYYTEAQGRVSNTYPALDGAILREDYILIYILYEGNPSYIAPESFWGGYPDWYASPTLSAWVVGSPTPTPIPGAVWLFGSGLLGLVGIGRKRFKK